jgi:hypothetical protein
LAGRYLGDPFLPILFGGIFWLSLPLCVSPNYSHGIYLHHGGPTEASVHHTTIPTQLFVAKLLGCEELDGGNVTTITYPKDESFRPDKIPEGQDDLADFEYEKGVDFAIAFHISCGIIWLLCVGTFQIMMARNGWSSNQKIGRTHKWFGHAACLLFFCYMYGATYIMLIQNTAHHVPLVQAALPSNTTISIMYIVGGILSQRGANLSFLLLKEHQY